MRILLLSIVICISNLLSAQYNDWIYSTTIHIQDPNGRNETDYPVLLRINTQQWINDGFIKNDASDLRFAYDCLGEDPIPYWIEDGLNTDSTNIWVRVRDLPFDGELGIYAFGGNPAAASESNFNAVFPRALILPTGNPLIDEISPRNPLFRMHDPLDDSIVSNHVFNTDSVFAINTWILDSVEWLEIKPGFTWRVNKDYTGDYNEAEAVRDTFIHRLYIKNIRKAVISGTIDVTGMGWDGGFVLNKGQRPPAAFQRQYFEGFHIDGGWGLGGADRAFFNSDGGNVNGRGCGGGGYGCEGGVGTYAGARDFDAIQYQPTYGGISTDTIFPGSGGGGVDVAEINGAWPGGNGGGGFALYTDILVSNNGRILANGEFGEGFFYDLAAPIGIGAGGGSGGGILLKGRTFRNPITLQAKGGDGGDHSLAGGGGGGGRIKVFAEDANSLNFFSSVDGGRAGNRLPGAGGVVRRESEPGCTGSYYYGKIDADEEVKQNFGPWIPRTINISVDRLQACRGEELTFFVTPGFNRYVFVRNLDTISIQDSTVFQFADFQPGDIIYVYGEQIPGCGLQSNIINLDIKDAPDIAMDPNGPFCTSDNLKDLQEPSGLTGVWNGPAMINKNIGQINPALLAKGTYRYAFRAPVPGELCLGVGFIDVEFKEPNSNFSLPSPLCDNIGVVEIEANTFGGEFIGPLGVSTDGFITTSSLSEGTYNVTYEITDGDGCFSSTTKEFEILESPEVSIDAELEACPGELFTLTGNGAEFYVWEPKDLLKLSGNRVKTVYAELFSQTIFTLVGRNTAGCQDTTTHSVSVLPGFQISAGPDITICKGESKQLKASGAVSYKWKPAEFLNADNIPNPTCTPNSKIIYVVTGINAAGCSAMDTMSVSIVDPTDIETTVSAEEACLFDTVIVTSTNCDATYIYGVNAEPRDADSLVWYVIPQNESVTEFTVVRIIGDCVTEASFPIQVRPTPMYPLEDDYIMCLNDSIYFDGGFVGGDNITFSMLPAINFDAQTFPTNFRAGFPGQTTITFVSENEFGCSNAQQAIVNVNPTPIAEIDPVIFKCSEDSIVLNPIVSNGNPQITWTPALGLSSATIKNPTCFVGQTQQYVLRVKAGQGCEARDTILIDVTPGPNMSLDQNSGYCPGDSTTVKVSGANSYLWDENAQVSPKTTATVKVFEPLSTTISVVGVDNGTGCKTTLNVPIEVFFNPQLEIGDSLEICEKDSTLLVGLGANLSTMLTWQPPGIVDVQTYNSAKVYPSTSQFIFATLTTEKGCTSEDSVFVTVHPTPISENISPIQFVCVNDDLELTYSDDQYAYDWNPKQFLDSYNSVQVNFNSNQVGDKEYVVTISDRTTNCSITDTLEVSVKPLPEIDAGTVKGHCPGDSLLMNPVYSPDVETFNWEPSNFFNLPNVYNTKVSVPNTQYVHLTVFTDFGCENKDSILIRVLPTPNNLLIFDPGDICFGDTGKISLPDVVNWEANNGWERIQNDFWIIPNLSGLISAEFTATDSNGCIAVYPVEIDHFPLPVPDDISMENRICFEDTLEIEFVDNNGYNLVRWRSLNGEFIDDESSPITMNPFVFPIQIELLTIDQYKCEYRDTFTVEQFDIPEPGLVGETEYCIGDTMQFEVDGDLPIAYWTAKQFVGNQNDFSFVDDTSGTVRVEVIDANGCTAADSLEYVVRSLPTADAGKDKKGFVIQNFFFFGEGGVEYEWSGDGTIISPNSQATAAYFDMTDPLREPFEEFGLQLKVTDEYGCVGYDSVFVLVEALDIDVVPSAFTPNGDGLNDKLILVVREGFDVFKFSIWDRWGNLVYFTDTIVDWDGNDLNGNPVGQGVYVYRLLGLNEKGRSIEESGNITILK